MFSQTFISTANRSVVLPYTAEINRETGEVILSFSSPFSSLQVQSQDEYTIESTSEGVICDPNLCFLDLQANPLDVYEFTLTTNLTNDSLGILLANGFEAYELNLDFTSF